MSRRRSRPLLVPEARPAIDYFKASIMARDGYSVSPNQPNDVKYEVAQDLGIDLSAGYNGGLKSGEAGQVGGQIGGRVVRELVKMAESQLAKDPK